MASKRVLLWLSLPVAVLIIILVHVVFAPSSVRAPEVFSGHVMNSGNDNSNSNENMSNININSNANSSQNPDSSPEVVLLAPVEGEEVTSPMTIRGQARGTWFWEGSFPVALTNWDGLIIGNGVATAKGDWMTDKFVPFEATLTYKTPTYSDRGTLILKKDNPSGLPEYDKSVEIQVKLK